MFVQTIQGAVKDPAGLRSHMDRWVAELGPGAAGWLGSTAGVTDDGVGFALVRFESEEAARANSDRPEQGAWWEQATTFYDGEPTFQNCTVVDVDTHGDPADAAFVQVMQGGTTDVDRARELMASDPTDWPSFRPEILGTVWAATTDGQWTMAIYFTSEAEAREGEQKEAPPEVAALMEELTAIGTGEPTYLDLRDPWLHAPG